MRPHAELPAAHPLHRQLAAGQRRLNRQPHIVPPGRRGQRPVRVVRPGLLVAIEQEAPPAVDTRFLQALQRRDRDDQPALHVHTPRPRRGLTAGRDEQLAKVAPGIMHRVQVPRQQHAGHPGAQPPAHRRRRHRRGEIPPVQPIRGTLAGHQLGRSPERLEPRGQPLAGFIQRRGVAPPGRQAHMQPEVRQQPPRAGRDQRAYPLLGGAQGFEPKVSHATTLAHATPR